MTKIEGLIVIFLLFLVCCTNNVTSQRPVTSTNRADTKEALIGKQGETATIGDAKGVVVLNNHYSKNDFVYIYNADGSLWYKFSFYGDEVFKHTNKDFKPFAFHPDYFLLALKCVGKSENRFEVVVNEETGLTKYVNADDPVLQFETWEEHIPKAFAVDFNRKENPILQTPAGQAKRIDLPKEVTFHPIEIKGEWLKIRWNSTEQRVDKKTRDDVGWIKWKKDGAILIDLFYFS